MTELRWCKVLENCAEKYLTARWDSETNFAVHVHPWAYRGEKSLDLQNTLNTSGFRYASLNTVSASKPLKTIELFAQAPFYGKSWDYVSILAQGSEGQKLNVKITSSAGTIEKEIGACAAGRFFTRLQLPE